MNAIIEHRKNVDPIKIIVQNTVNRQITTLSVYLHDARSCHYSLIGTHMSRKVGVVRGQRWMRWHVPSAW